MFRRARPMRPAVRPKPMTETPENDREYVFKGDYLVITPHDETRVAVQVGRDPEEARPTIVDAEQLVGSLTAYLED